MKRRAGMFAGLLIAALVVQPAYSIALAQPATLEGRAVLPADTFAPEPSSGAELTDETKGGREPPFEGQPAGGFSAVLDAGDGEYLAMTDNGFSQKGNSADFLLRVYSIRPDFETGEIAVGDFIQLRDPERLVPFRIVNEGSEERLLTGADFDIESVRRDARGDLWFGDEFGPFLLHTDAAGRVLEAPIPLPGVKSPENPTLEAGEEPNLPTSKGFEGMAISEDGEVLYPMLEGALENDPEERRRIIYEFDLESGRYTGERWEYRTEAPEYSIGDLTALGDGRFLIIERDNEQGEEARFKRIYLVDLRDIEGFLTKREVLDLLSISDPALISLPGREGDVGLGDPFAFPFQTIESVLPLDGGRLLVLNDNNYPLSAGRNPDQPDDTEAIIVRPEALWDGFAQASEKPLPGTGGPPLLPLAGLALLAGALWALARPDGRRDTRGTPPAAPGPRGASPLPQVHLPPPCHGPDTIKDGASPSRLPARRLCTGGTIKIRKAITYREVRPMALYEYKCPDCEERFDLMRAMSAADERAECPECGGTGSRRLISSFASITTGATAARSNPVMDSRIARSGGGGCCGGGCCG